MVLLGEAVGTEGSVERKTQLGQMVPLVLLDFDFQYCSASVQFFVGFTLHKIDNILIPSLAAVYFFIRETDV